MTFRSKKKERHRILSEQAKEMADFYEHDTEWREWEGGPIVEYDISHIKHIHLSGRSYVVYNARKPENRIHQHKLSLCQQRIFQL